MLMRLDNLKTDLTRSLNFTIPFPLHWKGEVLETIKYCTTLSRRFGIKSFFPGSALLRASRGIQHEFVGLSVSFRFGNGISSILIIFSSIHPKSFGVDGFRKSIFAFHYFLWIFHYLFRNLHFLFACVFITFFPWEQEGQNRFYFLLAAKCVNVEI